MKIKRTIVLTFFVFVVISAVLYDSYMDIRSHVLMEPEPQRIKEQDRGLAFEMEQDYENIIVYTEHDSYMVGSEQIVYTIKNNNVGKGFYYYSIPHIEYFCHEEWIKLTYYPAN